MLSEELRTVPRLAGRSRMSSATRPAKIGAYLVEAGFTLLAHEWGGTV